MQSALSGDDHIVAHRQMTGGSRLTCEDAVVADFGGPGQASLTADHVVGA